MSRMGRIGRIGRDESEAPRDSSAGTVRQGRIVPIPHMIAANRSSFSHGRGRPFRNLPQSRPTAPNLPSIAADCSNSSCGGPRLLRFFPQSDSIGPILPMVADDSSKISYGRGQSFQLFLPSCRTVPNSPCPNRRLQNHLLSRSIVPILPQSRPIPSIHPTVLARFITGSPRPITESDQQQNQVSGELRSDSDQTGAEPNCIGARPRFVPRQIDCEVPGKTGGLRA